MLHDTNKQICELGETLKANQNAIFVVIAKNKNKMLFLWLSNLLLKNIATFVVIQLIQLLLKTNSYFCGYCSLAKLEIHVYIILCERGRERGHDLINYV